MKHIILFSGGCGSSYCAWLISKEVDKKDIILLHTPTYTEHPDADRFRNEVAEYLKLPITVQADGRDLWQLIDDNHSLPSAFIPFCTRILKTEQTTKFLKKIDDDYIIYLGYDCNEWRRCQKSQARNEKLKRKVKFPLFENQITSDQTKKIILNEWKIKIPESYKYFKHNNCIPCFKGGLKHWYNVYKYFPDIFQKGIEKEKQTGYTVFKGITLEKLKEKWNNQELLFEDNDNFTGCLSCIF